MTIQTRRTERHRVVILLLAATTINYIDRQTLSVLAPLLQKELSISSLEYSYVVNAFLVTYALMYLVMGRLVDRLGTRNGLGFAVIWWSLIEVLHVTVIGVKTLCLYRALLALGEAAIVPAGVKAVAEWFDAQQRGLAIGIFEMGFSVGPMLAPPMVGWISLRRGWHEAFLWTGLLGLVWAVPWFLFYHAPKAAGQHEEQNRNSGKPHDLMPWALLFGSKEVWAVGFARFLSDPVWYFYLFWLPKYLSDSKGLGLSSIAKFAWIPYLTSLAGGLTGGATSSWLMRRGLGTLKARQLAMLLSAVLVSSGVLCVYLTRLPLVLGAMSLATFAMQFWGANVDTLPIDLVPPKYAAQTMGFTGLMGAIGGILFTAGTGYTVQHYSYTPVWVASAVMYPTGLALLFLLLRRSRRSSLGITASAKLCV